tara:strand:- start:286 stop:642 length:357 start_codon:yes stop_codon:yes gene_type:complete
MDRNIINEIKRLINIHDSTEVKKYIYEILNDTNKEYNLNYAYIFKDIFNHACLKGNKDLIKWFLDIYKLYFSDVEKIALRQIFYYGKYIIINDRYNNIKNKKELVNWYDKEIISSIKD